MSDLVFSDPVLVAPVKGSLVVRFMVGRGVYHLFVHVRDNYGVNRNAGFVSTVSDQLLDVPGKVNQYHVNLFQELLGDILGRQVVEDSVLSGVVRVPGKYWNIFVAHLSYLGAVFPKGFL